VLVKRCQRLVAADAHKSFAKPLRLSELASQLVRLDHVASIIVNVNHGIM
jgi:hypothetical protein